MCIDTFKHLSIKHREKCSSTTVFLRTIAITAQMTKNTTTTRNAFDNIQKEHTAKPETI